MADGLDDLLDQTDSNAPADGGSGKGLRAQLEQTLAENKRLAEQLAQVNAAERQRNLTGLLDKHGIPSLAADLFPRDGELSDEAATAFIGKYGALWGAKADAATTTAPEQAATARLSQASATARTDSPTPWGQDQFASKLSEAKTPAEVMALYQQLGQAVTG